MKSTGLLCVFILAKLAILAVHTVPLSLWTPVAYFWQDVLIVLVFAAADRIVSGRIAWILYWALAIYAALNIPVGRAVSTPLTWPMLRAARGPLADSFLFYVTWTNVVLVLLVLAVAAILGTRWGWGLGTAGVRTLAVGSGLAIVALGPIASARVDTIGLHRNPIVALIASGLPHASPQPNVSVLRTSRFEPRLADDLSRFRGIAKDRNIVMVSLESTAAQYLKLYGAEQDVMPRLRGLAQNALVFDNTYAVYPESIKGLYSVLCSAFPAFDSQPEAYEKVPCRSVAAALAGAGYRTGLFHSGRFPYLGMESIVRNRGYQTLEDAGDIGGNHNSSFGIDEPATVARILAWIDAIPRGQRFFLTYLPIAGHHPYEAPARGPFPERDDIGRYRNALHYGDASLGALIDGLCTRGLEQDTVWVIFGDHGEAFGQHEGNYGHTFFVYDENIRVPFVIAAPGRFEEQTRVRKVVSLMDVAPTVLDLAGLPQPDGYQGASMLDPEPRMALFFTDYSLGMLGLRDGRWKFIYELDSHRSKLFDLDRDPRETVDVSKENPQRTAWYSAVAQAFQPVWLGSSEIPLTQARMPVPR